MIAIVPNSTIGLNMSALTPFTKVNQNRYTLTVKDFKMYLESEQTSENSEALSELSKIRMFTMNSNIDEFTVAFTQECGYTTLAKKMNQFIKLCDE